MQESSFNKLNSIFQITTTKSVFVHQVISLDFELIH
jgi:hypothetical protein